VASALAATLRSGPVRKGSRSSFRFLLVQPREFGGARHRALEEKILQ
jgi:hypothetical protein